MSKVTSGELESFLKADVGQLLTVIAVGLRNTQELQCFLTWVISLSGFVTVGHNTTHTCVLKLDWNTKHKIRQKDKDVIFICCYYECTWQCCPDL